MCAVEWKKLGDVCEIKNGYTPSTKNSDFWIGGNIPWFTLEDIRKNGRILNDSIKHITSKGLKKGGLFPKDSIIISTTATIGEYALVTSDYICNQQITSISLKNTEKNNILIKYLYYLADDLGKWCLKNVNGGGSLLIISISKLNNYLIPLPPLAKQQEIVSQLDTFTNLISNLESELDMRRKQYEHYRNQLLDFEGVEGVEWKTLGEVCTIITGGEVPENTNKGQLEPSKEYPYAVYTNGKEVYGYTNNYQLDVESVCISSIGANTGAVFYRNGKFTPAIRLKVLIPNAYLLAKYLFYISEITDFSGKNTGSVPNINANYVKRIVIPVPSLKTQQEIVEKLDAFEQLIQSLEQEIKLRKQQYEYYREKLLTFEK